MFHQTSTLNFLSRCLSLWWRRLQRVQPAPVSAPPPSAPPPPSPQPTRTSRPGCWAELWLRWQQHILETEVVRVIWSWSFSPNLIQPISYRDILIVNNIIIEVINIVNKTLGLDRRCVQVALEIWVLDKSVIWILSTQSLFPNIDYLIDFIHPCNDI